MGIKTTVTYGVPAAALLTAVGALTHESTNARLAPAPRLVRLLVGGAEVTSSWVVTHQHTALVIAACVLIPLVLGRLAALVPRSVRKDPQRMFSPAQRKTGFDRAEGRCEMDGLFLFRCRKPAAHGDHWFPWSKGGPTDMDNFVAGCASCNCSKGAKTPTYWQTWRLERRRRRYFPADLTLRPGGRYAAQRG